MKKSGTVLFILLITGIAFPGCASKNQDSSTTQKKATAVTTAGQSTLTPTTTTLNKEKIKCPECGKDGVPIIYGKPGPKTLKRAEEKKVYLGGCVLTPNSPRYHCYHCGNNWGTKKTTTQ